MYAFRYSEGGQRRGQSSLAWSKPSSLDVLSDQEWLLPWRLTPEILTLERRKRSGADEAKLPALTGCKDSEKPECVGQQGLLPSAASKKHDKSKKRRASKKQRTIKKYRASKQHRASKKRRAK